MPGFCVQQALNYADAGPVVEAAERLVHDEWTVPLLLKNQHQRSAYHPHPALLRTLEHNMGMWSQNVHLMPDGRTAAAGGDDYGLRVWDLATGQCLRTLGSPLGLFDVSMITPDGYTAILGYFDGSLQVWDLITGQCLHTLEGHSGHITSVSLTPDGHIAVSGHANGTLQMWDLITGQCLRTLENSAGLQRVAPGVARVSLTPDGRTIVWGDGNGLRVWDLATGQCLRTLEGPSEGYMGVSLTPYGRIAISVRGPHCGYGTSPLSSASAPSKATLRARV